MPDTCEELFSIAVFPYLKTSGPVRFGPYLFRSTDDLEGLSKAQVTAVTEVTAMLYTQNNARVRSASYAVIPQIHVFGVFQIPEALKRVHSLVAYLYGTPNDQFGDPFLGYECATLLVLTPDRVSRFLIESEHHTILDEPIPIAWDNHFAPGYDGMLNFVEHFWVVKGSRIYPPVPHITLNISRDLAANCGEFLQGGTGYELVRLLTDDARHIGERLFTALSWYNATNRADVSESEALVNLAIAFESLLEAGIPQAEAPGKDRCARVVASRIFRSACTRAAARVPENNWQFGSPTCACEHRVRAKGSTQQLQNRAATGANVSFRPRLPGMLVLL